MRRIRFLRPLLLVVLSSTWTVFFVFLNGDVHLSLWISSVKDDNEPALSKPRSIVSNPSSEGKKIGKRTLNKNTCSQQFSKHHMALLKRFSGDFTTNWCRIREAKLDWKSYLAPCAERTEWRGKYPEMGKNSKTHAANSFVEKWDIRPAGEFSKFLIHSKTANNRSKTIGGDSWRVRVKGASSVSATIFDHNNGNYEVTFLLMEPGLYQIEIILDYTLCDGFKDPPVDWYKKGSHQGKSQPDGTLNGDHSYLMEPLRDGKPIWIEIPKPKYPKKLFTAMDKIRMKHFTSNFEGKKSTCDTDCPSLVFDGLGRWILKTWKPYFQTISTQSRARGAESMKVKREPHNKVGILWLYGDSVTNLFANDLMTGQYSEVCGTIFRQCKKTYSWVYNIKKNESEEVDGKDYDHEKVMNEIKKVLEDESLDENSVIMLNWGIHFAAAVHFRNFKKLIDEFLKTVQLKRRRGEFTAKIIWRTTTAIFRERFPEPRKDVRRFLTFPRIILYNAYAMSAMCRAGVSVIDVYSLTDSFPPGTISKRDPVHYGRRTMEDVQAIIYHKFKPLSMS